MFLPERMPEKVTADLPEIISENEKSHSRFFCQDLVNINGDKAGICATQIFVYARDFAVRQSVEIFETLFVRKNIARM